MKQLWKDMGIAGIMGILVPGVLLGLAVSYADGDGNIALEMRPAGSSIPETSEVMQEIINIPVLGKDENAVQMGMDEYLTGVLLGEMPASFESEALKAQAVVARTYTVRAYEGKNKHENAAVCVDSGCCQAYISESDYLKKGGTEEEIAKMRRAVAETAGQVLTYEGELIEATYFSCSGGITEDAVAVWGTDVPYLRATLSPGEEEAAHYSDSVSISLDDFKSALSLNLEGDPKSWFGAVTYTAGGGVSSMMIGGTEFQGTDLRKLLGLRSTAFTISVENGVIQINTRGYGHRVGMSQYGADAMAASGSTYDQILAHYYQGTMMEKRY